MTKAHFSEVRLLDVIALILIALGLRLVQLDHAHFNDDYLHVLAALSWLRDGTLTIGGDDPYLRASLFTYMVAVFMALFGETTYVARLPAVLAGVLWVLLLFLWLNAVAGRTVAWIAALMLSFDATSIALAHMVRFYTLHGLAFFVFAVGVYYLYEKPRELWRSTVLMLVIAAALLLAYRLQPITVIGAIAVLVWLVVDLLPRALRYTSERPVRALAFGMPVALVVLIGLIMFLQSDRAQVYFDLFSGVPFWATEWRDDSKFYFRIFKENYGAFWALFPVAALVAIAKFGRPAIFAVILFVVPLLIHSLAAFKGERFLAYSIPLFFATWAMAIGVVLPHINTAIKQAVMNIAQFSPNRWLTAIAAWVATLIIIVGVTVTSSNWYSTARFLSAGDLPSNMRHPDWGRAVSHLGPLLDSVDIIVAAGGTPAFYHLDRFHVIAEASYLGDKEEFGIDVRLGLPVISSPESLMTVIRCYDSGIVMVDRNRWGADWGFDQESVQVLLAKSRAVAVPEEWGVRAFVWTHETLIEDNAACPEFPKSME